MLVYRSPWSVIRLFIHQAFLRSSQPGTGSLIDYDIIDADPCQPYCLALFQCATSAAQYSTTVVVQSLVVAGSQPTSLPYVTIGVVHGLPANLIRRLGVCTEQNAIRHGRTAHYWDPALRRTHHRRACQPPLASRQDRIVFKIAVLTYRAVNSRAV